MKTNLHINLSLLGMTLIIFLSVNSFSQINWDKYEGNPVLEGDSGDWYEKLNNPVVIHENGVFKMWFSAWSSRIHQVGYAESTNGLDWEVFPVPVMSFGQAGDWDRYKSPHTVIKMNDTLKMWYSGSTNDIDNYTIGYAWSVIEHNWNFLPGPVMEKGANGSWDDSWVYAPSVYYDGSLYYMWYSGSNDDWTDNIGYATSSDGINWYKDYVYSPVIELGEPGTFYDEWLQAVPVIKHNGMYQMWFGGYDGTNNNQGQYFRIGYATSTDGINWTIENNLEPVLDVGESGSWDDKAVHMPSVLIHENRYKMWYGGRGGPWKIGYALGDSVVISNQSVQLDPIPDILDIYPCPLTNMATISYQLPEKSPVTLEIYNNQGQLVSTLVNEVKEQGKYEIIFDSMGLQPGIYFCVLKTNEGIQTKKLIKLD